MSEGAAHDATREGCAVVGGDPHRRALEALHAAGIDFLLGGAFALQAHLGVLLRAVKDLDLFVRRRDVAATLTALRGVGYATETTHPHWLAKAYAGREFIDVIFSSGNGIVQVDDAWFAHATQAEVLGVPVLVCPPEEGIWARAFVMERERYDGADVAHLLRCCAPELDWPRLVARFGAHWRVLYAHLVLFGFIYPSERERIPRWVMAELGTRLVAEENAPAPRGRVCRGTLLSRAQFLIDVGCWGYADARRAPEGTMTAAEIAAWTRAIEQEEEPSRIAAPGTGSPQAPAAGATDR